MTTTSLLLAVACLLASCSAWERGSAAPRDARILLTVGVKQQNVRELEAELLSVSRPDSPRYGEHLSFAAVNELTAPSPADVAAVTAWLSGPDGLREVRATPGSAWLRVSLTVAEAEELLQTTYHVHTDAESGARCLRAEKGAYSLPAHVEGLVDVLGPVDRTPVVASIQRSRSQGKSTEVTTPSTLRALYGLGDEEGAEGSGNSMATANFLEQYYKPSDLQTFFDDLYPVAKGREPYVLGPNDPTAPGIESSLDIQYIMSVGGGVNTTWWSTAGTVGENEPFLEWLADVSAAEDPPLLFSISYADFEDTVEPDYAFRVSTEFAKLGARGITIISGSGDGGVEGAQPRACPNGKFVPTFPCTSEWETCVGGTEGGYAAGDVETAVAFTGGGFSNYFGVASYQASSVAGFLATEEAGRTDPNLFNATGRGFPDVAAMAVNFELYCNGSKTNVGGTSAATPTFAGVAALLNERRVAAGKPPLGFLNPLLYANPDVFTDITAGSNPGCNTDGFFAAKGWDPLTGLGTPVWAKLAALVDSLP